SLRRPRQHHHAHAAVVSRHGSRGKPAATASEGGPERLRIVVAPTGPWDAHAIVARMSLYSQAMLSSRSVLGQRGVNHRRPGFAAVRALHHTAQPAAPARDYPGHQAGT